MLKVAAVGCSLGDYLYTGLDFSAPAFQKYASKQDGDGGLVPGRLVFTDALSTFAGKPFDDILPELTGGHVEDKFNLGGPAIVALINAAQLTDNDVEFDFYGTLGVDETADKMLEIIGKTRVNIDHYRQVPGHSPFTKVLSDPKFHDGKGERTFLNHIGAAGALTPASLPEDFFTADVHFYGATALTPGIHDSLTSLLRRSKEAGKITMVSTVFDFRNENRFGGRRWPLGESDESYSMIDLLAVDWEEGMRLSGRDTIEGMVEFFSGLGLSALVVTHGAKNYYVWSSGKFFKPMALTALPVCHAVDAVLAAHPERRGDTTGCGDNFAGGLLAGLVRQAERGIKPGAFALSECCAWAGVSGGFACLYVGGTYTEQTPGEKLARVKDFHTAYVKQLAPYFA